MNPKTFVARLADIRLPAVFNPYTDRCAVHDRGDAARCRRQNLELFLEAALDNRVQTIWVARDLGYRGGRRTGVALTDPERNRFKASHTRACRCRAHSCRNLECIIALNEPVFLWNVFPFHPHEPRDQFSNRCHTQEEREISLPLLQALIDMIQPRQIIAIGRDAQVALKDLETPVAPVRHPSYGGQSEFVAGLSSLYGLSNEEKPKAKLAPAFL